MTELPARPVQDEAREGVAALIWSRATCIFAADDTEAFVTDWPRILSDVQVAAWRAVADAVLASLSAREPADEAREVCTGDDHCRVKAHWPDPKHSGPHRSEPAPSWAAAAAREPADEARRATLLHNWNTAHALAGRMCCEACDALLWPAAAAREPSPAPDAAPETWIATAEPRCGNCGGPFTEDDMPHICSPAPSSDEEGLRQRIEALCDSWERGNVHQRLDAVHLRRALSGDTTTGGHE